MNTMAHEGLAAIPIRLLPIKATECVAYLCTGLKRFLSLWEPWEGSAVPFLQISPYLILSVLALTLTPGISGGNYFPAFPPTCHPSKTVDSEDKWKVGLG